MKSGRVAFTLNIGGGIEIYWYAILIVTGIIAAVIIASILAKKKGLPADTAIDLCLVAVPLGLICARAYYVLLSLNQYHTFAQMIDTRQGGLAIPGAIIGGALGIFIYSLFKKRSFFTYADVVAPGLAIAQSIGRWGNFVNQEAFGIATLNEKLWYFPICVRIDDCGCEYGLEGIRHAHFATFFYESMFCLLLFVLLLVFFKRMKHKGDVFVMYAMCYTFERFFIESIRTDYLHFTLFGKEFRATQLLCCVVFVALCVFVVVRAVLEKKKGVVYNPADPIVAAKKADDCRCGSCKDNDAYGESEADEENKNEEEHAEENLQGAGQVSELVAELDDEHKNNEKE